MTDMKIRAFKGFNKNMTCRGFQYEVGKEYEIDGEINPCKRGFHACENPLNVLDYYGDVDGKYCVVEQGGMVVKSEDKQVSSKIKINTEIGFIGLFKYGIEWIKMHISSYKFTGKTFISDGGYNCKILGSRENSVSIGSSGDYTQIGITGYNNKASSSGHTVKIGSAGFYACISSSGSNAKIGSLGEHAKISSSGDHAQISSSGNYACIASAGFSPKIESTGENSVILCAGINAKVKAKAGNWITLTEWTFDWERNREIPVCVKTEFVDGKRIKEDTWYKLVNGEFKEALR